MSSDHAVARLLADEAGERLLAIRRRPALATDPAALRAAGDSESHDLLVSRLGELAPGDAVLSEEGADDRRRLSAQRVWIIDPLDGTREFSEVSREDWAVHVALWVDGDLTAGAVAMPAAGVTLGTDNPPPAPNRPVDRIRLAVSRTRPPAFVEQLAEALDAKLVPMGSAGVKAMSVLCDEADAYVHAGGQFEWDSAAPVAVARAAGLHTSRIDGSPLRYNQPNPSLPDLVVCRPDLAERILEAIATRAVVTVAPFDEGTLRVSYATYQLSQLATLEAESIFIFREVVAEFEKPVLLFSGGKDSICMLRVAQKAFWPSRIPFPVMHVDTGHNFPEVLDFRDRRVRELGVQLVVASVQEGSTQAWCASRRTAPATGSRRRSCSTRSRRAATRRSSAGGGATRTRRGPRSASTRSVTTSASGTRRTSAPSCGACTTGGSTQVRASGSSRCPTGPSWMSGTTSNARRSSCPRSTSRTTASVSLRNGMLYAVNEFVRPKDGESVMTHRVRYRTVGDASLTAAVESDADTVTKVIEEVAATRITERGATRGDDKFSEAAMEDRKREGYF